MYLREDRSGVGRWWSKGGGEEGWDEGVQCDSGRGWDSSERGLSV